MASILAPAGNFRNGAAVAPPDLSEKGASGNIPAPAAAGRRHARQRRVR
jgi:hypothetical protein